jgi:hypothetical protein
MAEMQMREMAVCAREIECNRSAGFAGAAADFSQTELKALREIDTHAMLITCNRVADRFADRIHEAGNFEPRLTRVHIDLEGGWLRLNDDGTRWLSDDEFRRVLIYGGDALRGHVLWQVERFKEFAEKIAFLRKVWPRQLAVRTPTMIGRLCTLAFDDPTHFPELVSAILPLVSDAESGNLALLLPHDRGETVAKNYSDQVLDLLAAVLPADVTGWPHRVNQTLEWLTQAKPALVTDPRMIRLKGIWDRR